MRKNGRINSNFSYESEVEHLQKSNGDNRELVSTPQPLLEPSIHYLIQRIISNGWKIIKHATNNLLKVAKI